MSPARLIDDELEQRLFIFETANGAMQFNMMV
jgi:hypothetical protein